MTLDPSACGEIRRRCRLLQIRHDKRNREHGYVLTPGRYVGAEEVEDDGEPFEEKMPRLVAELEAQFVPSRRSWRRQLEQNLKGLGFQTRDPVSMYAS